MSAFLLEILSEEIPARFQQGAMADLERLFVEGLKARDLTYESIKTFITPRRLGLVAEGLPQESSARTEERKGPRVNAPEQAIQGFMRGAGVSSLEECRQEEDAQGAYWVAVKTIPAKKTEDILVEVLWAIIKDFPWKKSQNWAEGALTWVRPIRAITALFDGRILPCVLDCGNGKDGIAADMISPAAYQALPPERQRSCIAASNWTRGHRFHAEGEITVSDYADYIAKLEKAYVIVDREVRKQRIVRGTKAALEGTGMRMRDDPALLEEVAGLTEWPVPLIGQIDDAFMEVPSEVLITTMRNNQKYFSVENDKGEMQASFVITANLEAKDGGKEIIGGNERVLRARFADAKFFWDLDRKTTLEDRLPKLEAIIFHAKLGTLAQRAKRMEMLAGELAQILKFDVTKSRRAAKLAKADLVSEMVGEFPELQGIMGGYYARNDDETEEVAQAIQEHYSPLGPNDKCPSAPVSIVVALAEKLDTLTGFFAIDEKPTGSKDPFALRRAALGVLRILLENGLKCNLHELFVLAYRSYGEQKSFANEQTVVSDLLTFFVDRIKAMMKDLGYAHDLIASVFNENFSGDFVSGYAKLGALEDALSSEEGQAVLALYARVTNILKIEEKNDKCSYSGVDIKQDNLKEEVEMQLYKQLADIGSAVRKDLAAEKYSASLSHIVCLQAPLTNFFDKVIVNAEDKSVRANRLALLSRVRDAANEIADFSAIVNS